jgi:transposase
VWTVALARTLAEFNKLKGEGRSRQTETYMFLLASMYFSSELGRFHDLDREPAEVAKYKGLIAQFAVLASKVVPETVEVKAQKEKLSGKKELERLARMAADPDQDILYSIRGQVRRVFVRISNPFVTSSFVGPATTTSVSVDVELATMLSFSVEVRRHISLVDDAEEAAKGDDWTMADEALNKALRLEVNVTENNCTSRIGLIQLQKMVAEKRKDDERVRQLADELLQLELSMADVDEDGKVFNNSEIIIKIIH